MGSRELFLVGLAMLAGLLGVLTPGVPGPLVCWAAVLWWAAAVHTPIAWYVLAGSSAVLALGHLLRRLAPGRRLADSDAVRQTLATAGLYAIAGFFVLPVVGGLLGFAAALYAQQRARLGSRRAAVASTRVVLRAVGLAVLAELFTCLMVVGAWLGAVVAG